MSGGDTEHAPPPPPPPRSGSPFGRFLTSPVLLVGVVALAVGFAVFNSTGPAGDSGPASGNGEPGPGTGGGAPAQLQGTWSGPAETADGGAVTVRLTLRPQGGSLRRGGCRGTLLGLGVPGDDRAAFRYTERSRRRACPPVTRVGVRLEAGTLRITETLEGEAYLSGMLRRVR